MQRRKAQTENTITKSNSVSLPLLQVCDYTLYSNQREHSRSLNSSSYTLLDSGSVKSRSNTVINPGSMDSRSYTIIARSEGIYEIGKDQNNVATTMQHLENITIPLRDATTITQDDFADESVIASYFVEKVVQGAITKVLQDAMTTEEHFVEKYVSFMQDVATTTETDARCHRVIDVQNVSTSTQFDIREHVVYQENDAIATMKGTIREDHLAQLKEQPAVSMQDVCTMKELSIESLQEFATMNGFLLISMQDVQDGSLLEGHVIIKPIQELALDTPADATGLAAMGSSNHVERTTWNTEQGGTTIHSETEDHVACKPLKVIERVATFLQYSSDQQEHNGDDTGSPATPEHDESDAVEHIKVIKNIYNKDASNADDSEKLSCNSDENVDLIKAGCELHVGREQGDDATRLKTNEDDIAVVHHGMPATQKSASTSTPIVTDPVLSREGLFYKMDTLFACDSYMYISAIETYDPEVKQGRFMEPMEQDESGSCSVSVQEERGCSECLIPGVDNERVCEDLGGATSCLEFEQDGAPLHSSPDNTERQPANSQVAFGRIDTDGEIQVGGNRDLSEAWNVSITSPVVGREEPAIRSVMDNMDVAEHYLVEHDPVVSTETRNCETDAQVVQMPVVAEHYSVEHDPVVSTETWNCETDAQVVQMPVFAEQYSVEHDPVVSAETWNCETDAQVVQMPVVAEQYSVEHDPVVS